MKDDICEHWIGASWRSFLSSLRCVEKRNIELGWVPDIVKDS